MIFNNDEKTGIKLNGSLIPGLITSLSIGCQMIIDEKSKEGSGTVKNLSGFKDSDIIVDLVLVDDVDEKARIKKSSHQFLEELNKLYKKTENGIPVIYQIQHSHINSRGINNVVFESLDSKEGNGRIDCTCKFTEHNPKVAVIQQAQIQAASGNNNNSVMKKNTDGTWQVQNKANDYTTKTLNGVISLEDAKRLNEAGKKLG